jgi:hypothetical protein
MTKTTACLLAVLCLALIAATPAATAQAPKQCTDAGPVYCYPPANTPDIDMTIAVNGPITGLVMDNGTAVAPYGGNITVPLHITLGCGMVSYVTAVNNPDADHFHIHLADDSPAWAAAEEKKVLLSSLNYPTACNSSSDPMHHHLVTDQTYTVSLTPAAPSGANQTLNFTFEYGEVNEPAVLAQASFAVQYHAAYDVTPSIRFPYTVAGRSTNFTVTVASRANAASMVAFGPAHASAGTLSALGDVMLEPGASMTVGATFTAPTSCWSNANVTIPVSIHPMAGAMSTIPQGAQTLTWAFHNPTLCENGSTPGGDTGSTSKKSPLPWELPLVAAVLAIALARRRPIP